ncbi:hypothetical protein SteCoe_36453 [Stentor coeruleus]|uniref:Uncharacterized protein n=1 Tax=Stentor coeruleus TaxID=5963 RepID=A0A1R2AQ81_9CILI|nr:hypothetical protein SteCoe_36453 [Stentor coeruleus]
MISITYPKKHSSNLSVFTTTLNEKSFKNFEKVNTFSSKQTIEYKLQSIKKALEQKHEKVEFDNILNRLDVVTNETIFSKNRIELKESNPAKGYIEQNTYQFFEFHVKGSISPLKIQVELHKGKVENFLSFTYSCPNQDFHEKKFETEFIDVHSRYNVFNENKCYLGVHALINSRVSVQFSFCKTQEIVQTKKKDKRGKSVMKIDKSPNYVLEIQAMRENPYLKANFEKKVNDILLKRRANERLNFIHLNKSLSSTCLSHELLSSQLKTRMQKKQEDAKKRKIVISEEKLKTIKYKLERKQLRKRAEEQAQEIHAIIVRKENFEKKWFVLLNYFQSVNQWLTKLKHTKQQKINLQIMRMKAYIIQKKFKKKFDLKFSFSKRILASARNHMLIFHNFAHKIFTLSHTKSIIKCITEMSLYQQINDSFDRFHNRVISIQRTWRRYSKVNAQRVTELLSYWAKISEGIIAQLVGKTKKRKKNHIVEKITNISLHTKERMIKEHLLNCKLDYINKLHNGKKPDKFEYMIDEETMRKVINSFTLQKIKTKRSILVIHDKK